MAIAGSATTIRVEFRRIKSRFDVTRRIHDDETDNSMSKHKPVGSVKNSAAMKKSAAHEKTPITIGSYLIQRLQDVGVRDIFGIPGDFVLKFYGMLEDSPIRVVGTTSEACAGYAADGYARINGVGAVCVTYCVQRLSLCNSIAGVSAEKSPVIISAVHLG